MISKKAQIKTGTRERLIKSWKGKSRVKICQHSGSYSDGVREKKLKNQKGMFCLVWKKSVF